MIALKDPDQNQSSEPLACQTRWQDRDETIKTEVLCHIQQVWHNQDPSLLKDHAWQAQALSLQIM